MENLINNLESSNLLSIVSNLKDGETYSIQKGEYVIKKEDCVEKEYYVSNTLPISEKASQKKRIMFYLKDKHDIVIDGNGSTFYADGKEIFVLLDNCVNITFKNITFDYIRPTVTEFDVISMSGNSVEVKFNDKTPCTIKDGKISLVYKDEDYIGNHKWGLTQEYVPEKNITYRMKGLISWKYDAFEDIINAENLENGNVKLTYSSNPPFTVGYSYQFRNLLRDAVGFFIVESANAIFENVNIRFMHGLGLVCQCSKDITVKKCEFTPSNGRKTTGFADLIHCIGCSGTVDVEDCVFDGAHDDTLNIHGVHQKIVKYISKNEIVVSFMHPEAHGYKYYDVGDELQFVDAFTLKPFLSAKVIETKILDLRRTYIKLDKDVPSIYKLLHLKTVVENISKNCANLIFNNNYIYNIPTRGILISTMGKVVVKNNHFVKTQMSGVLISDDALTWYESGRVTDVTIENNEFDQCEEPVIYIHPENLLYKGPIHNNITIKNNHFNLLKGLAIDAKATSNLIIENNTIDGLKPLTKSNCKFRNCKDVTIQ